MKKIRTLAAFCMSVVLVAGPVATATAHDIRGTRLEIRSIAQAGGKFAFLYCDKKSVPERCDYIGKIDGYTAEEIAEISRSELVEARFKTGGVVAVAAVGAIVGFFSGVAVAAAYSGATAATITVSEAAVSIGVGTTITRVGSSPMLLDKLNPWHQYDQAEVLQTPGLLTKKIYVKSDHEIQEIAQLMIEILE